MTCTENPLPIQGRQPLCKQVSLAPLPPAPSFFFKPSRVKENTYISIYTYKQEKRTLFLPPSQTLHVAEPWVVGSGAVCSAWQRSAPALHPIIFPTSRRGWCWLETDKRDFLAIQFPRGMFLYTFTP